jgi:hypothetical protein
VSRCPGLRRRERGREPRTHKITVRLSDAELAALTSAAGRTKLALAAYLSRAGMDAAEHRAIPVTELQREALAELIRVAGLLRRAGGNLNQAVARLNATGQPGPDLGPAAAYCMRAVERVDQAATQISRALRRPAGPGRRSGGRPGPRRPPARAG